MSQQEKDSKMQSGQLVYRLSYTELSQSMPLWAFKWVLHYFEILYLSSKYKTKNYKTLRRKQQGKASKDIRFVDDFLAMTPKVQATEAKIAKLIIYINRATLKFLIYLYQGTQSRVKSNLWSRRKCLQIMYLIRDPEYKENTYNSTKDK